MQSIFDQLVDWLKEMLVSAIMTNMQGLFDSVNNEVSQVASQIGTSRASFSPGVFTLIRNLSENVIMPIAGIILTFIACYELIQLVISHNNLANFETWIFYKKKNSLVEKENWNILMSLNNMWKSAKSSMQRKKYKEQDES